jgi:hypothetical protein
MGLSCHNLSFVLYDYIFMLYYFENLLSLFENILLQLLLSLCKSFFQLFFLSFSFHLSILEKIVYLRVISTQQLFQLICEVFFFIKTVHILFVDLLFRDLDCLNLCYFKISSCLTLLLFCKLF